MGPHGWSAASVAASATLGMRDLAADLERYCLLPALSGHEDAVIRAFAADLRPLVDELSVDALGNVLGTMHGSDPAAPSVMVFAHLDQLGMVVQRITDDGFVKVARVGGLPERVLAGQVVHILRPGEPAIPGVVGTIAHHLTPEQAKYVVPPIAEVAIDVGARSAEDARDLGVEVGRPVVYEPRFLPLLHGRVAATSLDDRGGIAALLSCAQMLSGARPPWTVHIVGTVQEEFTVRGAVVAAEALRPRVAVCLDVVPATDSPQTVGHSDIRLGGGPVLGTYTFHGRGTLNGLIPDPRLVSLVTEQAGSLGIAVQRHATVGLLTDTSYVQFTGEGVAAVELGWAVRYTHSPVETCQLSDLRELVTLTSALVRSLPADWPVSRVEVPGP